MKLENKKIYYNFTGGTKSRKGVGIILNEKLANAVKYYDLISERIMCIKVQGKHHDILIFQVYAPTEDSEEEDKELFYENLDKAIKNHKSFNDQLIIMGDFNAKVGHGAIQNVVGNFGMGDRNENGEKLIEFCKKNNVFVTNTWYEQKIKNQHTWNSPDNNTKNQIDYILGNLRYRNSIRNVKVRRSADCGSDHHALVIKIRLKLKTMKKGKRQKQWNTTKLKESIIATQFKEGLETKLESNSTEENVEKLWALIRESITQMADNICGKKEQEKQQPWITTEILQKMTERRNLKNRNETESKNQYKEINKSIRRMCREAKEEHYKTMCKELEELDKKHCAKLYTEIKKLKPKKTIAKVGLLGKDGKMIQEEVDKLSRWKDYVEELYNDNRENIDLIQEDHEKELVEISESEVKDCISQLPNNKATGIDEIPSEFLKQLGPNGITKITQLINKIYKTGVFPKDFLISTFIPLPKVTKANKCEDHRTISLIAHASKILLYVIKKRITPIIERHLAETQVGFREGTGTRDGIFLLRTIGERRIEKNVNTFLCFIDYTKAFDRVQHHKLLKIMEDIQIPFHERRLIRNLYYNQKAHVRYDNGTTEDFDIRKGVRQGCILSPILFNLYSERIINETLVKIPDKGIKFNGHLITNVRYADDTVILADSEDALQEIMSKINETCKQYGMLLNAKKTKTMILTKKSRNSRITIKIDGAELEQVKEYKYLGTIITEDCRCNDEVRRRIGQAKNEFWNCKEFLRRDINLKLKLRLLSCYIKSILSYGSEAWTFSKKIIKSINAFQIWCYRRILKISYRQRIRNDEVINRIGTTNKWADEIAQRKMRFAGHILRRSSGTLTRLILEGLVTGKRDIGRQRRTWGTDIKIWSASQNLGEAKRKAENRICWKNMIANLRIGEGTR